MPVLSGSLLQKLLICVPSARIEICLEQPFYAKGRAVIKTVRQKSWMHPRAVTGRENRTDFVLDVPQRASRTRASTRLMKRNNVKHAAKMMPEMMAAGGIASL